jgi:hypothetical protein
MFNGLGGLLLVANKLFLGAKRLVPNNGEVVEKIVVTEEERGGGRFELLVGTEVGF